MTPEELLAQALAEKPKERATQGTFMQHARAIEVLKRKGLRWSEIAEWFTERGVPVKWPQSLAKTLRDWGKTQDYIDFCAEQDKEKELDNVHG